MDCKRIYESVCFIVKDTVGTTNVVINDKTNIIEDGLISSLKLVEMIIKLEEHFSIEFDAFMMNAQNFATITNIFEIVSNELLKKEAGE